MSQPLHSPEISLGYCDLLGSGFYEVWLSKGPYANVPYYEIQQVPYPDYRSVATGSDIDVVKTKIASEIMDHFHNCSVTLSCEARRRRSPAVAKGASTRASPAEPSSSEPIAFERLSDLSTT